MDGNFVRQPVYEIERFKNIAGDNGDFYGIAYLAVDNFVRERGSYRERAHARTVFVSFYIVAVRNAREQLFNGFIARLNNGRRHTNDGFIIAAYRAGVARDLLAEIGGGGGAVQSARENTIFNEVGFADANRDGNYEINLPIFEQMGAFWTGMGYIESAGFLNGAYGYETFPVDVYYLYIYLSTGVIGSVIIAIPLIYMLIKLIRKKTWFAQIIGLSIYIAMLFDAFWQVNLFTYRYIPTLFLAVLIITEISKKEETTFEKTK